MDMHEPMTLGSPVSHATPVSASSGLQQYSSSQYLPGFLMGDHSINKTPVLNRSSNTPGLSHSYLNSQSFGSNPSRSSPPSAAFSPGAKFGPMIRSRVNANSPMASKEKSGGPPVSSLNDDVDRGFGSHLNSSLSNRSGITDIYGRNNTITQLDSNTPRSHRSHVQPRTIISSSERDSYSALTPPSPAQVDPFYTQGEAITSQTELDETWVTVFGFPPNASSYIIQQFSKCGVILEHSSAHDEGNWINLRFESKLQAKKALSKSGKILPGNLMIGVTPCIDLKVMNRSRELDSRQELLQQQSLSTPTTPGLNSTPRWDSSKSALNSSKPCTIRPLTAAYDAASSNSKVANSVKTPQKTSGMLTKAMDYIFG